MALLLVACAASAPKAPASATKSACPAPCRRADSPLASLRVALSDTATDVCLVETGCLGDPRGTVRRVPLQAPIREAVADSLRGAGFELVGGDEELELVASVEWRGTDTLVLALRDARGRLVDQVSYRRSLDPCRALPELTWETCWVANRERMKAGLSLHYQTSPAVQAFLQKSRGATTAASGAAAGSSAGPPAETSGVEAPPETLNERLSDQQIQETVARYREHVQRHCWQPAREAREPTAPSSARVSTWLTVAASGTVLDVKAGGDPLGYPGLAACLTAQVRAWRFPAAKSATTATMPFVFAGE